MQNQFKEGRIVFLINCAGSTGYLQANNKKQPCPKPHTVYKVISYYTVDIYVKPKTIQLVGGKEEKILAHSTRKRVLRFGTKARCIKEKYS